jgi:hypothetical protein
MFCKRAVNDSLYSCTSGGHRVEGDGGEKYLSFSNLPQSPQIYRCLGCLKIWSAFPGEVVNGTKSGTAMRNAPPLNRYPQSRRRTVLQYRFPPRPYRSFSRRCYVGSDGAFMHERM